MVQKGFKIPLRNIKMAPNLLTLPNRPTHLGYNIGKSPYLTSAVRSPNCLLQEFFKYSVENPLEFLLEILKSSDRRNQMAPES